ncbi:MAG TPA: cytochrome c biogenesis protein CcsA [Roseiflexaceae bacterium]|nr:cytochrome c biogenesis protein CcsA [Roseiflexaceae bacterium]
MNIGHILLALALISGLTALGLYAYTAVRTPKYASAARTFAASMTLFVVLASMLQWANIMTHQFQYEYVRNFTDRALPELLLFATFWGGQSGSFLLWALMCTLFTMVLIWGLRHSAWEPFVLTPYLLVALCVTGITLAAEPFKLLPANEVPADGNGLNPLLQNYWMAIHPPFLFSGFTTMAGPFAVAALWRRDYDGWVKMAKPWTILAWLCMGTGLALGGFWAYESLGWGGFWGWDPVENSSLVPWLFASALIHGLLLQGARGSLKRTNLALAIFGYLMVIYSTFLTRSGVLGNFSIHSFVELGLMNYLLTFIAIFALLGFGMLAARWRSIGRRVAFLHVISREFALMLSLLLFVIIALIVGIGTSMPVVSMLPIFPNRFSLDLGWYGPNVAPFGLLLFLSMAVGPLLGWQRQKYGTLRSVLRWPAIVTGVVIFACLLLNIIYPVALLFIAAAVFAIGTNLSVIARIWRAGPLKLGGYLSHIGASLFLVGAIGTMVYKQTAATQLIQGEPQQVFGRQIIFTDIVLPPDDELGRTAIQIEVVNPEDGSVWVAEAPYYVYDKTSQLVTHPDIQPGWWADLYVSPSQYLPAPQAAPGLVQLEAGQPRDVFGYTLTFQEFDIPNREAMMRGEAPAEVFAVVDLTAPDGTQTSVRPMFRVGMDGTPAGDPISIPGGATLTMKGLDPASRAVQLQFGGIDLSQIDPNDLKARVFVEISVEPGIRLVWAGIIITVIGGLLALLRRWREARPADEILDISVAAPRHPAPALQPRGAQASVLEGEVH